MKRYYIPPNFKEVQLTSRVELLIASTELFPYVPVDPGFTTPSLFDEEEDY